MPNTLDTLRNTLAALEQTARRLEPSADERRMLQDRVLKYGETFLDRIYDLPAFVVSDDKGLGLYDSPITEDPGSIDEALKLLWEHVDMPSLNPASGGHLGYIPGGGIYYSALGDYLADITNRFAGLFFASPGAVRMENMLIRWMAELVGYPSDAGGNLTSGGSIANLTGIVTARDAHNLRGRDFERSVIYLTSQAHHSVDKAIRIAGLNDCPLRYIPVDERFRMDANALERAIREDNSAGLNPFLVIAAAGTTDAGAVDPLHAIADICAVYNLWFHLDGAYGAFFVLCDEGKKILAGIERSDSVTMDPHKGLFLPYGTGAVLIRDSARLYESYRYQASYLQDAAASTDELSPADLSPELTKHFRGLRLWLALKVAGVAPFRAAIEEKLLLARYFYERMREMEGFELGPYPDLSVLTYRYVPKRGDADDFNRQLLDAVHRDGRVFLSSTTLDGKFTLRLAVLSFRSHRPIIDLTLDILRDNAARLEREL